MKRIQYLIKFSQKNITRNTKRSLFICLSIALSISISIIVTATFDGLNFQIEEAVKDCNIGDYQIQDTDFFERNVSFSPLRVEKEILERLQASPLVKSLSPELVLNAYAAATQGSLPIQLLGTQKIQHQKAFPLSSQPNEGIVIGKKLAAHFQLNIGDTLVIHFQSADGQLLSENFSIDGIYEKNGPDFEKKHIYIGHDRLAKLLWPEKNMKEQAQFFNRIIVRLFPETTQRPQIAELGNLPVKTWRQINSEMSAVIDFHKGMSGIFTMILLAMVFITILIPISISWQERLEELSTLKIIGMSKKDIWFAGLAEGFYIVLIAITISTLISGTIIFFQTKNGIDLMFLTGGQGVTRAGIRLEGLIYPIVNSKLILSSVISTLVIVSLSYVLALGRVMRKLK